MNITFFLGNGFDRALGLKTGYSNFYNWYCTLDSDSTIIKSFRKNIDNDINASDGRPHKVWSDAELGLAKATSDYDIDDFVVCCEDLHDRLTEYITKQDAEFHKSDINHEAIAGVVAKQILEFQQDLTPTEAAYFSKRRKDDILNHSIINIITLNYTKSWDTIFKLISSKPLSSWNSTYGVRQLKMGKLVHAHGYIDNYPILGVCDPELIEKQVYLNNPAFRALMIKKDSIDAVGETWRNDTIELLSNSNIICIFGASLGASDSDYWKLMASWLNFDSSRQLIIFWHDSGIKQTQIKVSYYQQFILKRKIQDKFLSFSDFSESGQDMLREQIHVVINAPNMFVFPDELKIKYPKNSYDIISSDNNTEIGYLIANAINTLKATEIDTKTHSGLIS